MRRFSRALFFLLLLLGIVSCNPLRSLKEGESLLNKNIIRSDKPELNDGMRAIIKQKPNRKILGVFRFHLGVYSFFDSADDSSKFRNWIKNTIGEKPVILEPVLSKKSSVQIRQYMFNSGYFNAEVTDTTIYKRNNKKAKVIYIVKSGAPYFIRDYKIETSDSLIAWILKKDTINNLLKANALFDANLIQKERDRVTNVLKNEGYYFFSSAYIRFEADSGYSDNKVGLKMIISRINEDIVDTLNPLQPKNHQRYHLQSVYIQTDYNPLQASVNSPKDTILHKGYFFVSQSSDKIFKIETILHHLVLRPGELFQQRNLENTYKMFGTLNVFKFITIKFEPVKDDSMNISPRLNCFINLTPNPSQEHREEIEGTHNGGALGIAGNISYRNKNFLRGAELLEIKLKGALESIKNFSDTVSTSGKIPFFNTFEIGPEINLSFPKILFPRSLLPKKLRHESPYANENSTLTANYDLQQRPEFKRTIANFSLQWSFHDGLTKSHFIYPFEINFVNVRLNNSFKDKLNELNDPYLFYTYADHLITNGRWTYIYNTQNIRKLNNFIYFQSNIEFAGNSLWVLNHWFGSTQEEDKSFRVLKTRYAQYFKPDIDFRFYHVLNANNTLVYRVAGGIGIPYLNSFALPFEKAFFAGGSNDLRAFRARTVGPGAFTNSTTIDQTGQVKLNANAEFRFDIFKILQGALFLDAGNIWLLKEEESRPGGQFRSNKFLSEIAVGGGLGARVNFTFFIIRLDVGVPFKNPSFPPGDRWVIKNPQLRTVVFNLGIGYPF